MAEQWNGSSWQLQTVPSGDVTVNSVSCTARNFCQAVGLGSAYVWNGSAWTSQAAPSPATNTFAHVNAVSCASASSCEAGGYWEVQVTSDDPKALAEYLGRNVVVGGSRRNGTHLRRLDFLPVGHLLRSGRRFIYQRGSGGVERHHMDGPGRRRAGQHRPQLRLVHDSQFL